MHQCTTCDATSSISWLTYKKQHDVGKRLEGLWRKIVNFCVRDGTTGMICDFTNHTYNVGANPGPMSKTDTSSTHTLRMDFLK